MVIARISRLAGNGLLALLAVPGAALACDIAMETNVGVTEGAKCSLTDVRSFYTIKANEAVRLNDHIARQGFSAGQACDSREFLAYYDCDADRAVILEDQLSWLDASQPGFNAKSVASRFGALTAFRLIEEQTLMPEYDPDEILTRANGAEGVDVATMTSGRYLTIDDRRFDLACGCDLPQSSGL